MKIKIPWNTTGLPEVGKYCLVRLSELVEEENISIDELRYADSFRKERPEWINYYAHNITGWVYLEDIE